jgi:two-component system, chemotaxis family, chemotaxis protein CheY
MGISRRSDGNSHHPRVLVIDDDDELAEVLRQALRESGYAVATVRHGAAALDLIGQIQPDLILLDLRMPIMDGWSFAEQYRRSSSEPAAIIVMSGVRDLAAVSRMLGAAHHLQKPFDLASLTKLVASAIPPGPD